MSAGTGCAAAIAAVENTVKEEMSQWGIGGIAIAITDGQQLIHAAGYGEAERGSVFRAGSVSKLFNAIAVMQLVEAGKLKLDTPLDSLPGAVVPVNPFASSAPAITLRHLLSHRSGLQREAPAGSYFDASQPTLAATCESVRPCAVVTPPGAKTRYSNLAPSLAGRIVEAASGREFAVWQAERLFAPLGMTHSAWLAKDVPGGKILPSYMRVADGRGGSTREPAPLFDLGTIPAGNLYTTAPDLAQFLFMLDARGTGTKGRVLKPGSLAQMLEPQIAPGNTFGLGFALGKLGGRATIGHNGAVYGHSAALLYLPDVRLGVVVLANEDIVNARVSRIANEALTRMIEAKTGEKRASPPTGAPAKAGAAALAGAWESQSFWCELAVADGSLAGSCSGQPCTVKADEGGTWRLNSRIHDDVPIAIKDGSFTAGVQVFTRVPNDVPRIPADWRRLCGSYGPRFIPLVVHEKLGRLYATTENMVDYRLTPVNRLVFRLPPGMYEDEHAVFLPGKDGRVHAVDFATMHLPRLGE